MATTILDANQVIKKVYDEAQERLRVDAEVHATFGDLEVSIDQSEDSILVYGQDSGTTNRVIRTDSNGELQVDILSSALPSGAATEAKQDVGNASLASIDGKINNNYGVASGAVRTAAQVGNTVGAADFNAGITSAQTLRASANITRNGTELSYNNGIVDANTIRVTQANDVSVTVIQSTHDNLNLNANIQVSNTDVSNANPVPVSDAGGSLSVDQSGNWSVRLQDGSGNNITSQTSSAQRALDVGVNVSGVQVDPRQASPGTLTDFSGTATSASATIIPANANRKYLLIQNATANIMWINFTAAATAASPSIRIAAGETFTMEGSFISTEAITAIRNATVNVAFTAKEGT